MRRTVDRLLRTTAAALVLTMPAHAAGVGVYYRQNPVTFDTPIPLAGETPAPVQSGPLAVEKTGKTDLHVGEPLSIRFTPTGGVSADWRMTYSGPRPAWLSVVESGQDVVLSAASVPATADLVFQVSLTDKVNTVAASSTLKVVPALVVASASGNMASVQPGAAWNYVFDVSGGKGPYTIETSPASTGNLAAVVATKTATKVTFTGNAPLGSYPMTVKATDAIGGVVVSTLNVVVEYPPEASTVIPNAIINAYGGYTNVSRSFDQPDWNILMDGQSSTYLYSTGTSEAQASGVSFAGPVTFTQIFYRGDGAGTIYVKENGTWVSAGYASNTNGINNLTRSFTATAVKVGSSGNAIHELRVGNANPTTALPALVSGTSTTVGSTATSVATSASFTTANPYAKSLSLAETPSLQNGVVLNVTATGVTVASRPVHTTDVFVVVKDDTGMKSHAKFQIRGTADGATSVYDRPTGIVNAYGGNSNVSRSLDQPDWNILVDGQPSTFFYSTGTPEAQASGVTFTDPIALNQIFYRSDSPGTIYVRENGTWVSAGYASNTNGTNNLFRAYSNVTGIKVGSNGSAIHELRAGGTAPTDAKPTIVAGVSDTVATTQTTVATTASFQTANPYAKSLTLEDTATNQNGVVLDVRADSVTIVSRPAATTDVFVWVRDDTGMKSYAKFQVRGTANATASVYDRPNGIINAYGGNTNVSRSFDQPDWNILVDGQPSTFFYSTGNPEAQASGVTFANPIALDRIFYRSDSPGPIYVRQNGAWVGAGYASNTNGVVVLSKAFAGVTGIKVGSNGNAIHEIRAGGTAAVDAKPVLANGVASVVAANQSSVATATSFTTANPYASSLSFVDTPTSQNGVVLSVTQDTVSVVSRPAATRDVFVNVKDDTGVKSVAKFTVRGSSDAVAATYEAPNGIINAYGGTTNVAAAAGQPHWNVLVDGSSNTYFYSTGTSEASASGVTFAVPIALNQIFYRSDSPGTVYVRENGTWVTAGYASNTNGINILNRAFFEVTAIKVGSNGSAIHELRAGAAAPVGY